MDFKFKVQSNIHSTRFLEAFSHLDFASFQQAELDFLFGHALMLLRKGDLISFFATVISGSALTRSILKQFSNIDRRTITELVVNLFCLETNFAI